MDLSMVGGEACGPQDGGRRSSWPSTWWEEELVGLWMMGGRAHGSQYGGRSSLWGQDWYEEELVGLRIVGGACGPQDGMRRSLCASVWQEYPGPRRVFQHIPLEEPLSILSRVFLSVEPL